MFSSLISPTDIKVTLESTEREEVFAELLELMVAKQKQIDRKEAMYALCKRESLKSTAVFPKIAIPHAVCKSIKKTCVCIGVSKTGIEFESADENSTSNPIVNIIIQILFEESDSDGHLHVLRDLVSLIEEPDFVNAILFAKTPQDIYDYIVAAENK